MESPAQFTFALDGATRMFPIPIVVKGDQYIQLDVDGTVVTDRSLYDIINNKVVFWNTDLLPNGSTLRALVAQSDETLGQIGGNTTAVETVASNIANINAVAGDLSVINQIAPDLGNASAIAQLQTDTNANTAQLIANGITLNSYGTQISAINSELLDLATATSVFGALDLQNVAGSTDAIPTGVGNFTSSGQGNYMALDATNGYIRPTNSGWYRVSVHATIDIVSSSTTRSINVSLKDVTNGIVKGAGILNIPRDASFGTASFTSIINLTAAHDYGIEFSSSTSLSFTLEHLNFSIERV